MTRYALYNIEHRTFLHQWVVVQDHESFGWHSDADFALTWSSMTEAMLFAETHELTANIQPVTR